MSTRLRLDAALYDPPPSRAPRQTGRPRLKGKRRPTLEAVAADEKTQWSKLMVDDWYGEDPRAVDSTTATAVWSHSGKPPVVVHWMLMRDPLERLKPQALLSTNRTHTPEQMLTWFVRHWSMEVPFAEARAHLGMETQRQWHEHAIDRTTPALLRLYAIITLAAHQWLQQGIAIGRPSAWYIKAWPTFADAIAFVHRHVWEHMHFSISQQDIDRIHIPRALLKRFMDAVCSAT